MVVSCTIYPLFELKFGIYQDGVQEMCHMVLCNRAREDQSSNKILTHGILLVEPHTMRWHVKKDPLSQLSLSFLYHFP